MTRREFRPVSAAPPSEQREPDTAALPEGENDEPAPAEQDEQPGWPPLRKVAQRGADFDWGG